MAARDLGIRVTAPIELRDAAGETFVCEAFVEDFGAPGGMVVVSAKTERRVRRQLRTLDDRLSVSVAPDRQPSAYSRKDFIDALQDWGWSGSPAREPSWFVSYHG